MYIIITEIQREHCTLRTSAFRSLCPTNIIFTLHLCAKGCLARGHGLFPAKLYMLTTLQTVYCQYDQPTYPFVV